jgi:tRNA(Ile)-lysidine synthase
MTDSQRLLVAFSGGADSSVLLASLVEMFDPSRIAAAYVNHHLRNERLLDEEIQVLEHLTSQYGVDFQVLDAQPGRIQTLAARRGCGIEEAARIIRYGLLEQCREERGYDWILTAHHADDQAETVLMRVLKGSGVSGISGIPERNAKILRPLLSVTRDQIIEYAETCEIAYVHDLSNDSDEYERNRIRAQLMPLIRELYPQVVSTLCTTAEKAALAQQELDVHSETPETVSTAYFNGLSRYRRMELLYGMWDNSLEGESIQLPFHVIRECVYGGIVLTSRDSSRELFQYRGRLCYAERGELFIEKQVVPGDEIHYLKVVHNGDTMLYPGCRLRAEYSERIESDAVCVPADRFTGTIIVRSVMQGDVIDLAGGSTRVSKLFRDWKIPVHKRSLIPILEHQHGIIGVMGRAFGYRDRISRECRVSSARKYLSFRVVFD